MTSTASRSSRIGDRRTSRRWRGRALAVLGATAAAAAGWLLARPVAGVDLEVVMGGRTQSVGLASVIGTTVAAGLLGWGLLALLEHRIRHAAQPWTAVAVGVTVLSLVGPLASATSVAAGAVLAALHLLVAAVLVPALRRSSAREEA